MNQPTIKPEEKTCGTCRSIVKVANNAQQIGQDNYQCRCMPPMMIVFGPGQATVTYPSVHLEFPACDQHKPREAANG